MRAAPTPIPAGLRGSRAPDPAPPRGKAVRRTAGRLPAGPQATPRADGPRGVPPPTPTRRRPGRPGGIRGRPVPCPRPARRGPPTRSSPRCSPGSAPSTRRRRRPPAAARRPPAPRPAMPEPARPSPAPAQARQTTSVAASCHAPPASGARPAANSTSPAKVGHRRPKRSARRPPTGAQAAVRADSAAQDDADAGRGPPLPPGEHQRNGQERRVHREIAQAHRGRGGREGPPGEEARLQHGIRMPALVPEQEAKRHRHRRAAGREQARCALGPGSDAAQGHGKARQHRRQGHRAADVERPPSHEVRPGAAPANR